MSQWDLLKEEDSEVRMDPESLLPNREGLQKFCDLFGFPNSLMEDPCSPTHIDVVGLYLKYEQIKALRSTPPQNRPEPSTAGNPFGLEGPDLSYWLERHPGVVVYYHSRNSQNMSKCYYDANRNVVQYVHPDGQQGSLHPVEFGEFQNGRLRCLGVSLNQAI